jgi:hypothetical protein
MREQFDAEERTRLVEVTERDSASVTVRTTTLGEIVEANATEPDVLIAMHGLLAGENECTVASFTGVSFTYRLVPQ